MTAKKKATRPNGKPTKPAGRPKLPMRGDKMECPNCQCRKFKYIEDIQNARDVIGIEGDLLTVDSFYTTGEGYDDGENGRLMCTECCDEFAMPDNLEVNFV